MNIYLVKRTDSIGWDEYDAMVVAAETEAEARLMQPGSMGWGDASPRPSDLSVELIGTTDWPAGVILGSFNAG